MTQARVEWGTPNTQTSITMAGISAQLSRMTLNMDGLDSLTKGSDTQNILKNRIFSLPPRNAPNHKRKSLPPIKYGKGIPNK